VAEKLNRTEFDLEKDMRDMLLKHPEMIPVYEIEEDIKLLTIKRELRVFEKASAKFADAVSVDKNGSIYLVETKLFRNEDKRHVVAQVLSYGASLWASSEGSVQFLEVLDESCNDLFGKPFLDLVRDRFSLDDGALETFKDALVKNWDDGIFKFIVYMDKVSDDLKNLVTYINKRSRFDIYIVGVDYYTKDGIEIIIPKLYGVPDRKEVDPRSAGRRGNSGTMTSGEFLESSRSQLGHGFDQFNSLFSLLMSASGDTKSFRSNSFGGSYTPKFRSLDGKGPFSLKANGDLQIYLNAIVDIDLDGEAHRIRGGLVSAGLLSESETSLQPIIPLSLWSTKLDDLSKMILPLK
jgi:hypothetical protein